MGTVGWVERGDTHQYSFIERNCKSSLGNEAEDRRLSWLDLIVMTGIASLDPSYWLEVARLALQRRQQCFSPTRLVD